MSKPVQKKVKLQIEATKATPAPPVGTALGPTGINMMKFCKEFNERTKDSAGMIIPVVVSIYGDKSYSFDLRSPPAAVLIKKALGIEKGSNEPNKNKVASITHQQLADIAKLKQHDLNANDVEAACKIIAGTARSMGVTVVAGEA